MWLNKKEGNPPAALSTIYIDIKGTLKKGEQFCLDCIIQVGNKAPKD